MQEPSRLPTERKWAPPRAKASSRKKEVATKSTRGTKESSFVPLVLFVATSFRTRAARSHPSHSADTDCSPDRHIPSVPFRLATVYPTQRTTASYMRPD